MVDFEKFKKKKRIKRSTFNIYEVIIISLGITVIFSLITGFVVYKIMNRTIDSSLKDINETYSKIVTDYYGELNKQELAEAAIDGMMTYLDERYSTYMNELDTSDLNDKLSGTYRGIGIELLKREEDFLIVNVFDGTPASDAGVKSGDILINVNGEDLIPEMSNQDVASFINLRDDVEITVKRDDEELAFKMEIKTIDYPVVTSKYYEINNQKIGYIYLNTFSANAASQVRSALEKLENNNIDSLIFDVRGNTGGYLQSCNDILEMFLKKNKTMYYLDYKDSLEEIKSTTKEERNYKIVVLINGGSASASEILAASLKESYGAILVGSKTFGKGMVQSTSTLSDDSMIKYSTAKWYTPNKEFIDEIGITPGITVKLDDTYKNEPTEENDLQLQKALEILSLE